MQTLCPYETVAFGYSAFCDLFTYEEWRSFEYSIDLSFAGNNYFQSPTGRAIGIGYVEEILARLQNHVLTTTGTQANITLDNNTRTFPLNQTLYFDFSHDTNIAAVLTAFGLTQFAQLLPSSGKFGYATSPMNRANHMRQRPLRSNTIQSTTHRLPPATLRCPRRHRSHLRPSTHFRHTHGFIKQLLCVWRPYHVHPLHHQPAHSAPWRQLPGLRQSHGWVVRVADVLEGAE